VSSWFGVWPESGGGVLDPKIRAALDAAPPPDYRAQGPALTRATFNELAARLPKPNEAAAVEDRTIGAGIRIRLYRPEGKGPFPVLLFFHGGGWVVGDLETHDATCRYIAHATGAAVLAVDYRLAPEHRFPAAVDDAVAAFAWAVGDAASLGADSARVGVAGDSAGGNLAAVVAQQTTRAGGPRPAAQLLIYPVTDLSTKHPSYRLFSDGFFLTEADMDWYRGNYLRDEADARDPLASPLLAPDVAGLPPAIVLTAGFDVLRDEGEAYARRLRDAGVSVELRRTAGQIHGFANAIGVSPGARAAMDEAARLFRELLG